MNIDWDRIANDADGEGRSPRAVLLRYLEDCDNFDCLVVIANKYDDEGDSWSYESSGSALKSSAVMGAAYRAIKRHVDGNAGAD